MINRCMPRKGEIKKLVITMGKERKKTLDVVAARTQRRSLEVSNVSFADEEYQADIGCDGRCQDI